MNLGRFLARHERLVRFAAIAAGVYMVWFVVYDLWLLPEGRVDEWLSGLVASISGGVMRVFGQAASVSGRVVTLPGTAGIYVADGCNGLSTFGLFAGFVLAYPGPWLRKSWFIPFGILMIISVNILRLVALLLVQRHWPGYFEVSHSFGASFIFYIAVFLLWVLWVRIAGSVGSPFGRGRTGAVQDQ